MNYQQINWLTDEVMPKTDGSVYKVVSAVARKTWGWNKATDTISISQFMELTGIANRTNMIRAIQKAIDDGYITREENGQQYDYRMTAQLVPNQYQASAESVPVIGAASTESAPELVLNQYPQIERKNKEEEAPSAIKTMAARFVEKTGIFASMAAWESDWVTPLQVILTRAGDIDTAVSRIDAAVDVAREKGYTIKSPMSLTTIIANLNGANGHPSKVLEIGSR